VGGGEILLKGDGRASEILLKCNGRANLNKSKCISMGAVHRLFATCNVYLTTK